ncbi:SRPBCC family protein [Streptomyces parvulus]|uniref:SRPBCC family protein n=1 Tax=Streptomyces parvulus TaxID=146923 RepID=UPI00341D6924
MNANDLPGTGHQSISTDEAAAGGTGEPEGRRPLIGKGDVTVPVTVQTRTSLSPRQVFDVIVPIDLSLVFTGWGPFPGVRGATNQSGAWDAAGQTRNPDLSDGSTALERLTEYSAPHSFAYELSEFTGVLRHLVAGVRGEWTFTPDGPGTLIRWTYEFKPLAGRRLLLDRIVAPLWRRYMSDAVRKSAVEAERRHA